MSEEAERVAPAPIPGLHLDVLSALQQPLVETPGVLILFLLDLKVDVGLPQNLEHPEPGVGVLLLGCAHG